MPVLFTQSNYTRLPQFRIQTSILDLKGKLVVEKKAVSTAGLSHIKSLQNNYLLLKSSPEYSLPKILKSSKQGIRYEYVSGSNLQVVLEQALIKKDFPIVDKLVEDFLAFVLSLPVGTAPTSELTQFVNFLSLSKPQLSQLGSKLQVHNPGILDLKMGNFIRQQNNKIYLVDHEWVYDMPIPVKFILWRALFNLIINLQQLIRYASSTEYPSYQLSDLHQCPISWWKLFGFSVSEYKLFAGWESQFQKIVTGRTFSTDSVIYSSASSESDLSEIDSFSTVSAQIPKMLLQFPQHTQRQSLKSQIAATHAQVDLLERDLLKIQSSKFYRLWQGYNALKKVFN